VSIEDDIAFLDQVPTLSLLGRDALRILAIGAESRYLRAGEILFALNDVSDAGFVVQEGRLKLVSAHGEGGHEIHVGPGTLLGEAALLVETRRPGTAMAMQDTTVLRISRSLFMKTMEGFPEAAARMRDLIARRTSAVAGDLSEVSNLLGWMDEID
jgi:CRP-like cAMP-binding protein